MTFPSVVVVDRDEPSLDHRDPAVRMSRLADPGSLEIVHRREGVGVVVARGRVDGVRMVIYCTDATLKGGAIGVDECPPIADAIDLAVRERCPVVGVWHSGGAKLHEGVSAMHEIGEMFAAMVRASGRVPQVSVVLGPAAGGAAYGPALTDIVIMSDAARVFVTGPDVVRSVTGERIDMESLGGPDAHSRRSGVAHIAAGSEEAAFTRARQVVTLLARPGAVDMEAVREERPLRHLLPDSPRRAYDVRPLVRAILDGEKEGDDGEPGFVELQPRWAPNMVTGFGRLAGRTVGVIANNPLRKGGCLDSLSSDKTSRFVRMCDSFGVPLLVLVDVPGYLPGVGQEWEGVVRRGAKLLHAFAEASVPRVTLVTRKSYGGAYIAMNSRSLGATAVFAWPEAEVAIMGAKAAVEILHRKKLAAVTGDEREALLSGLAAEHERIAGGVARAVSIGVVDEVIDPARTRLRLGEALAAAPARRGRHTNIPL
ncbi:carboxyl transferase domain-containing protein [Streptosporangium sp. NPDC048865]|uniref:acyl-CoA carboxylase subunit beta n=1 Tax=Streptosporangium sp. NPDC048865 TaxID=3155766 RepID=UPI003447154B